MKYFDLIVLLALIGYTCYKFIYKEYKDMKKFLPVRDVNMDDEQRAYVIKRLNKVETYLVRKREAYPNLSSHYGDRISCLADIRYYVETKSLQRNQLVELKNLLETPVVSVFGVDIL